MGFLFPDTIQYKFLHLHPSEVATIRLNGSFLSTHVSQDQSNEMHGLYIPILHVNLLLSCGNIIYISVADLQIEAMQHIPMHEAADRYNTTRV